MGTQRILVVLGGAVGMLILMLWRQKRHPKVQIWKYPVVTILLTIAGVFGAMLMHYIENGSWSGTSFFGAVLFIPILMLPALVLKIPFSELMDLCAPAECLMLAFMKIDCLVAGCCFGKYMPALGVQFPSQIVEMINALIIMVVLLILEQKDSKKGRLYGWYLILYGGSRFVLNWFRYGAKAVWWIFPISILWAIASIIIGIFWLILIKRIHANK